MSELSDAAEKITEAAARSEVTTEFFDSVTTLGVDEYVTNTNNGLTVPSVQTQIKDLYDEDGNSLAPYAAQAEAARDEAVTAKDAAVVAQVASEDAFSAVETASDAAIVARNESVAAQAISETARDESVIAKTASETAKDESVAAKDISVSSQAASEAASTLSITAQGLSEDAQLASETARDAAVVAQTASEDAFADAETASNSSITASNESIAAKDLAELAQAASESARFDSIEAKSLALIAQSESETARDESVVAKTASETAQSESQIARDASETAQGLSEDARDASIVAQGLSETARDESVAAKDEVFNRTASYEVETTEYLINTFDGSSLTVGDIVKTLGYTSGGDGGKGDWVKLSDGATVSQSPSTLETTQLSDSTGNLYELVAENNIVDIKAVGGIGGGDLSLPILAATNGASSGRKILDLGNDNVNVTGTLTFPNTLPIIQGSRGALIGDGTGDVIISNSATANGKKKVFGTITGMDRALVVQGSINDIEFHTLSVSRQCLVIEALTASDTSFDNVIRGVQIGGCTDAVVFQQYADSTIQQGNEINVNFLSGVVNAVVFDDDGNHTQQADWDANIVNLRAIDNQQDDASFVYNRTLYPVNNQTVISDSWNGGLGTDSYLIKGAFRGCVLTLIAATYTTPDDVCSLDDSTKISTCKFKFKRAGSRISTTAGEMVNASGTQDLASFNDGNYIQSNSILMNYTLTSALAANTSGRAFVFHTNAFSLENNPFSVKPFNTATVAVVDLFPAISTSSNADRGMISIWYYNKTGAELPIGTNIKFILSVE